MKQFLSSRGTKCVALLLTLAAIALFCQNYLFAYYDLNTHRLRGFYQEEENSLDVVFMGASEVFTGVSPGYAYDEFGFTCYMYAMDSNQGSLYKAQLREILSRQQPQVLYVDVFGFLRSVETSLYDEARLRIFVESIPLSKNKLETIFSHPYEDKISCLLPLIKYHGDLGIALERVTLSIKQLLAPNVPMDLKGMNTRALIFKGPGDPGSQDLSTFSIAPKCKALLREFLDLCASEVSGQVVFVNFPRFLENEENHNLLSCVNDAAAIIAEYGFPFINLQECMEEIGIDVTQDFYNEHHLNIYGQKKLTDYFGRLTLDELHITPMAQSEQNKRRWEEAAACAAEYTAIAEQAIADGNPIWLDELSDEWLFRRNK